MDRLSNEEFAEMIFKRLKDLALKCIPICDKLFNLTPSARNISRQLAKSSSSAAANYRAARRARSKNEFYSKLSIVIEELDETEFWLEFSLDAGYVSEIEVRSLINEAQELLKILSKSRKTLNN